MRFDLNLYRAVDPAARRLFLLLNKVGYRRMQTVLETRPDWDNLAHHEDDKTTHGSRQTDAGCSLANAESNIRRSLRAVGPIPEGERYGAEWRAVEKWCEETGLILPARVKPERKGGRERSCDPENSARANLPAGR